MSVVGVVLLGVQRLMVTSSEGGGEASSQSAWLRTSSFTLGWPARVGLPLLSESVLRWASSEPRSRLASSGDPDSGVPPGVCTTGVSWPAEREMLESRFEQLCNFTLWF